MDAADGQQLEGRPRRRQRPRPLHRQRKDGLDGLVRVRAVVLRRDDRVVRGMPPLL